MLHSLRLSNFCSFKEEQLFNLDARTPQGDDIRFVQTGEGRDTALASVIFGANASGKTNFLRAFSFLDWFINQSWAVLRPDQGIPIRQFRFMKTINEPTKFELQVESQGGSNFIYCVELNQRAVISESLSRKLAGGRQFSYMFKRSRDECKVYPKAGFRLGDIPKKALRNNASFIGAAIQSGLEAFSEFLSAFVFVNCVDQEYDLNEPFSFFLPKMHENPELMKFVVERLLKLDNSIKEIEIAENELNDTQKKVFMEIIGRHIPPGVERPKNANEVKSLEAFATHIIDDDKYVLPLTMESNGICNLLVLLSKLYTTFKNGALFVCDEIEKGLHPELVENIFSMFYDEAINPKYAQIVCAGHSVLCMNSLSKYQIFLVEKNRAQQSRIYRLGDVAGVRNDDNFMHKYLAGAYGANPQIAG